jgi:hypothetical protein
MRIPKDELEFVKPRFQQTKSGVEKAPWEERIMKLCFDISKACDKWEAKRTYKTR